MLHDIVQKGSTDRSVTVRIIDSTDGTPETGVVFNTSGIDLWYRREGAARVAITEATLAALTTAHTDGGFLHVSDGVYRLDLPDAAFATGANYVDFGGTVTGMVVIGGRVRLVDYSLEDAVRMGLTALPNAAAAAAGGLVTSAGANVFPNNSIPAAAIAADAVTELQAGLATSADLSTVAGYLDTEIAAILADTNELQTDWANGGRLDLILDARASQSSVDAVDTVVDAIQAKTDNLPVDPADQSLIVAATTAIYDRVGAPAGASLAADVAAVKAQTAAIEADTQDVQTRLPAALVSGRIDASVGAMAADTLTASAVAADAVTELQAGLATAAALATVDGNVDALGVVVTAIDAKTANLPTDPADASVIAGRFDTVDTALGVVDGNVDAVKAKTDQLAFTTGNVHADIKAVIADPVQANGATDTNWGGTPP
jgi:hypothetical protein